MQLEHTPKNERREPCWRIHIRVAMRQDKSATTLDAHAPHTLGWNEPDRRPSNGIQTWEPDKPPPAFDFDLKFPPNRQEPSRRPSDRIELWRLNEPLTALDANTPRMLCRSKVGRRRRDRIT